MDYTEKYAVRDEIADIERSIRSIRSLGSHRNYSLAITKLEEARLWLRDRLDAIESEIEAQEK